MTDVMTMRLKEKDKEMLSFSSKQTGIPSSKLLYPFISEAIRLNLGASILFNIDRNMPFQRGRFERFVESLKGHDPRPRPDGGPDLEPQQETAPRIMLDFFWMFKEVKGAERLESAMQDVQVSQDMGFLTAPFMRSLCIGLGESYTSRGLSLVRIETDQARRLFFLLMTSHLYSNNAKGTAKALTAKWYSNQDLVNRLVEDMVIRYEARYPTKVVEAIEVREAIPVVPRKPVQRPFPPKAKSSPPTNPPK